MPLGIKPTVDFAFKKIFGSPENRLTLIGLLNAILEPANPIEDVELHNPFNYQDFRDGKRIVLDIHARDESGRGLNIEMQVSRHAGLMQRLTYYACHLYTDQLKDGEDYYLLKPSLSICLLNDVLFKESPQQHHRFQMMDRESGRVFSEGIEVHTLELGKYNLSADTISRASPLEQWVFFLLHASDYDADDLRDLLPAVEFQQAINTIQTIADQTEDKEMYDQREKAQRDYNWGLASARMEGEEIGEARGLEKGLEEGREKGLILGRIQALQNVLGDGESTVAELDTKTLTELKQLLADLQSRMQQRGV